MKGCRAWGVREMKSVPTFTQLHSLHFLAANVKDLQDTETSSVTDTVQ